MASSYDLPHLNATPNGRRASETSFEAWLPQFSGLYRPRGIEILTTFDEFVFKCPFTHEAKHRNRSTFMKKFVARSRLEVYGNQVNPVLVAVKRRSILHPFTPPISIYDLKSTKILTIDSFQGIKWFWDSSEVQILSSTGMIGLIRVTISNGIKTYELFDSYSQLTFYITPNLAPHQGLQLLILGAERSVLTGAVFERRDDFSLEVFKPLSANLKAILISFALYIIFTNSRTQFDLY